MKPPGVRIPPLLFTVSLLNNTKINGAEETVLHKIRMTIENRTEFVNELISRVLSNAPVSEVMRVYSLSVQAAIEELDDEGFLQAVLNAGYTDLIEKYSGAEAFFPEISPEDTLLESIG